MSAGVSGAETRFLVLQMPMNRNDQKTGFSDKRKSWFLAYGGNQDFLLRIGDELKVNSINDVAAHRH